MPVWTPEDNDDARIVYFRKEFTDTHSLTDDCYKIRISADSRYKLYVNGIFVQEGPQKAYDLRSGLWILQT